MIAVIGIGILSYINDNENSSKTTRIRTITVMKMFIVIMMIMPLIIMNCTCIYISIIVVLCPIIAVIVLVVNAIIILPNFKTCCFSVITMIIILHGYTSINLVISLSYNYSHICHTSGLFRGGSYFDIFMKEIHSSIWE